MKNIYHIDKKITQTEEITDKTWISIVEPTEEDKNFLLEELKIPVAFYNDIEDIDERPRIEVEDDWTFVLLRIPHKTTNEKSPFITVPLGIIYNDDYFVTVSFYKADLLQDFVNYYSTRKTIEETDNLNLIMRFHLSASVWFLKYLKQINIQIKTAENDLERSIKNEDLQTLFNLEKSLVYFNTSLRGNEILLFRFKSSKKIKNVLEEELLEDVEIELKQAIESSHIFNDILSGMMNAYASVISNNLNVIMKRLTSISIILMIPTLIASIYGMNVTNHLERNPNGIYLILLGSFLLSILGVWLFLKKKWI
jgi:magnesium transporter